MKNKTIAIVVCLFLIVSTLVSANPFNLPLEWVLSPNGSSVDSNGNGIIDRAETISNLTNIDEVGTITAGTWQGDPIADAYIASSAAWNNKAGGGDCLAGEVVQNSTTTGPECLDISPYLVVYTAGLGLEKNVNEFLINSTWLNDTIDARAIIGTSKWNITVDPYLYDGGSNQLRLNETLLNDTIDNRSVTSHSNLSNLNWSVAGHVIDTDVNMEDNSVVGVKNITAETGGGYIIFNSSGTYIG